MNMTLEQHRELHAQIASQRQCGKNATLTYFDNLGNHYRTTNDPEKADCGDFEIRDDGIRYRGTWR